MWEIGHWGAYPIRNKNEAARFVCPPACQHSGDSLRVRRNFKSHRRCAQLVEQRGQRRQTQRLITEAYAFDRLRASLASGPAAVERLRKLAEQRLGSFPAEA
jgi:hypothetical protein